MPEVDPIDGAHVTSRLRPTPRIHRYPPSAELTDVISRFWIPIWSLTQPQKQSTLQHPVCLIVVSDSYARFYGPNRGLSTVTLEGDGWAVGTMLTPAAGQLLWGRPMPTLVDRYVDLGDVPGFDGTTLIAEIRAAMTAEPSHPDAHAQATAAVERAVSSVLPVDPRDLVINDVVGYLRDHPEILRVAELADAFAMTERSLHRLVEQRVGLTPKWLIQRRRLHDAVFALKLGAAPLAELAAELGYADQAHFTKDFKNATGLTPGAYLAEQSGQP